jgi:RsiW-degrading membrane proteinase PrsW (M82 family)
MSTSILIASVIPLIFVYLITWLNFFETHRVKLILLALAWGAISVELSYLVDHPLRLIFGVQLISTRTAPFVEEIFKSLVLLYIVRRAHTTFFVDGAVYGFAAGIGFAIAENMLYLSRVDVDTGVVVSTVRAFVSSVMHGSTTAIVGMVLAGFPMGGLNRHPLVAWVIGLAIAIACHMAYNNTAFHHFAFGQTGYLVLAAIAFSTLTVVAIAITWGLRREHRRLRKSLGIGAGVSKGEAMLVQRIDDLDELLAPVEARFGEVKREQVANVLLLGAQLAMKQDQLKASRDPELREALAPQITELKRELRQARHDVGLYVMSYVRSIVPKPTWSLWVRLGQTLAERNAASTARASIWEVLRTSLVGHNATGESLHSRVRSALDLRERAAALSVEGDG